MIKNGNGNGNGWDYGDSNTPSSKASLVAAASRVLSAGSQPPLGISQFPFRFLDVITKTLPALLAIGMAQQTTRGLTASFLPMIIRASYFNYITFNRFDLVFFSFVSNVSSVLSVFCTTFSLGWLEKGGFTSFSGPWSDLNPESRGVVSPCWWTEKGTSERGSLC